MSFRYQPPGAHRTGKSAPGRNFQPYVVAPLVKDKLQKFKVLKSEVFPSYQAVNFSSSKKLSSVRQCQRGQDRQCVVSSLASWPLDGSVNSHKMPLTFPLLIAPLLAAVLALRSAAVRMRCDLLRGVAAGAGMEHGECEALSPLLPMQHRACHRPSRCPVVQTM